jgi:hypothetical protein
MDNIEQTVRRKLSEREKQKFLEYYFTHPEYRNKVDDIISKYGKEVYDKILEEMSKSYMENCDERKKELKEKLNYLKETGCFDTTELEFLTTELESLINKIDKYNKPYDRIVESLSEIAREKSVDEAVRDETIYDAIREQFPTEQSYREHLKLGREIVKQIINLVGEEIERIEEQTINQLKEQLLESSGLSVDEGKEQINQLLEQTIKQLSVDKGIDSKLEALVEFGMACITCVNFYENLKSNFESVCNTLLKIEEKRREEEIKQIYGVEAKI